MTIDEFKAAELKIGIVQTAERVEGSEKLLKLQVDFGSETRQIISGVGKAYEPESLRGKRVVAITNLDPRMMMGFESNGMLLAASNKEGKPIVLTVDGDVAPGTPVT